MRHTLRRNSTSGIVQTLFNKIYTLPSCIVCPICLGGHGIWAMEHWTKIRMHPYCLLTQFSTGNVMCGLPWSRDNKMNQRQHSLLKCLITSGYFIGNFLLEILLRGLPYMTSAVGGGVPKKQTKGTKSTDLWQWQGGRGKKIRKICGRHIWKPP